MKVPKEAPFHCGRGRVTGALLACWSLWLFQEAAAHEVATPHMAEQGGVHGSVPVIQEAAMQPMVAQQQAGGVHGSVPVLQMGVGGMGAGAQHAELAMGAQAEGGEEGMGAEAAEGGEEEEQEMHFSAADVEVAWMLLGSVSFVMFLFYLVTWRDDDIRRYTWRIMSSTISIFLAVLLFQGFNEWVELLIEDVGDKLAVVAHFVHCFVYIGLMQLAVGFISGGMFERAVVDLDAESWVINDGMREDNGDPVQEEDVRNRTGKKSIVIDKYGMEVPVMKRKLELDVRQRRMKCYATLLAHMSGFAAIFAGGTMQHMEVFQTNVFMALLPVGLTQLLVMAIFHIAGALRDLGKEAAMREGRAGRRMQMMCEEVEEAENDVSSLAMSFLTVQVVRFAITGTFPNVEGLEEPELPHSHMQIGILYGIGFAFAITSVALVLVKAKQTNGGRAIEILLNTCAMCFAWCMLWSTRWVFVKHPIFPIDTMMGRVILALTVSGLSCLAVFGLDIVDDMHRGAEDSKKGAQAIQTIVGAIAILVGFSWETCFDAGVMAVASHTARPKIMKVLMGLGICALVMPMWRRHILTKAMMLQKLKEDREESRNENEKNMKEQTLFFPQGTAPAAYQS